VIGGELGGDYKKLDFLAAATIGLSYNFGGNTSKTTVEIPVIYEDTYKPQPQIIKEVKAPAKNIIAPFAVRFLIDKSYIEKGQKPQINKIAEYLKSNPETKIMLTGYADKETAYPEYNMRLSQRRVDSVKKYLINECGIAEDRIETNAKGDTERVYDEDFRWNRVVVMSIIEK
jgi:outer membrane protein OmpA-like peptidoglycan-associated protein